MKRLSLSSAILFGFSACTSFTPNRVAPATGSVGEEVYGVICDRMVAQNVPEDLGAAKYGTVCHRDYYGNFAKPEQVETTPSTDSGKESNRLARARLSALGKRRDDLIAAFNVVLQDKNTSYLDSLRAMLTRMTPLYDIDIPNLTNSASQALRAIDSSQDAVNGLTRVLNHTNYSNLTSGGGLLGVAVSQKVLPTVLDDTYRVFGHGSAGEGALNQLLFALENSAKTQDLPTPTGPRSLLGVLGNVAVTESAVLNAPGTDNLTVMRDACGNAQAAQFGTLYVDVNGDGCADTDAYGRYVDAHGNVILATPTPFVFASSTFSLDSLSRPYSSDGSLLFKYTNARHTVIANVVAGTQPLFAPGQSAVTSALTQLGPALGDLTATTLANGLGSLSVNNYAANSSPAFDMALAAAPLLRAAATNDFEPLTTLSTVLKANPQDGARLIRALVNAKNLANQDTQGKYAPTSTMWDEINDVLVQIADAKDSNGQSLGLIEQVLDGFSAQSANSNAAYVADAMAGLLTNKDQIDYNPADLNAAPRNLTDPSGSATPHVPVDRSVPTTGDNRSIFQRVIGMIAEGGGVMACNKKGATLAGLAVGPDNGSWDECTIFKVPDVAAFLIDTIATGGDATSPAALAHKGGFPLTPTAEGGAIDAILGLTSSTDHDPVIVENAFDQLMVGNTGDNGISGIKGLRYYPTPEAMTRMVFYRGPADPQNLTQYDNFLAGVGEPAATNLCPLAKDPKPGDVNFGTRDCSSVPNDVMSTRWQGTIFALEANHFYEGMRPLVTPFVLAGREDLLIKLFQALNKHWATPGDPQRSTDPESYAFSSFANMASYEPLLAKLFASSSDLVGSMQALSTDLITAGGAKKIAPLLYAFLSQTQNTALTDRRGFSVSNRNDGTQNNYTTPALLLVQALDEIDTRRALDPAGLAVWRTARSQLVDSLLGTTVVNNTVTLNNQGLQAGLPLLLDAAAAELRKEADFNTFVNVTYQNDMRTTIESPALEAGTTLAVTLHKDATAEQDLLTLLSGTLDPSNASSFAEVSLSLVNGVGALNDAVSLQPVTTAAAGALDPQTGALKMVLNLMQDTRAIDTDNDLTQLLVLLATPMNNSAATPLSIISDTIIEVQRQDPTQTQATFDQNDTHHLLQQTAAFLSDPQHGLQQLITIIQKRTAL